MAIRVEKSYDAYTKAIDASGAYTSIEIPFVVFEAADEDEALSAVLNEAAQICNGMYLKSIEIDERTNSSTFKVNAIYTDDSSSYSSDDENEDEPTLSFDCGGGTKRMTHSIKQTRAYGTKDAGGAIGWNGKSGSEMEIAGVDVPTAQLRETYTRIVKLSKITTNYKRGVAALVGKVNSAAFKGWLPGEVMFLGMSYSCPAKSSQKVTVTFNFAIQPNESEAKIGDQAISKKGFEYVWALSKTSVDEGVPKSEVEAIYVDQVCEYASFGALGL